MTKTITFKDQLSEYQAKMCANYLNTHFSDVAQASIEPYNDKFAVILTTDKPITRLFRNIEETVDKAIFAILPLLNHHQLDEINANFNYNN